MKKYNQPEFKVTECSTVEDILTTSNYTDLNDSTDYIFNFGNSLIDL